MRLELAVAIVFGSKSVSLVDFEVKKEQSPVAEPLQILGEILTQRDPPSAMPSLGAEACSRVTVALFAHGCVWVLGDEKREIS